MVELVSKSRSERTAVDKMKLSYRFRRDFKVNRYLYIMITPVVLYYVIFHYGPMYGIQIAFKNYSPGTGIWGSPWVGFKHFKEFFDSYYFWRLIRNTLLFSFYGLLFQFTSPILLALLLNEIRSSLFKRIVQSVTYLPHFISLVVVVGLIYDFLARDGLINNVLAYFGVVRENYLASPGWFRTIFISSGVWQLVGWGTIIYLAAIANIDPSLYDAAKVDGANRFKQMFHITLAGIRPTIIILFIFQIGSLMSVNSDKILLLYNPVTYETADVIGTFVYRKGILEASFSYSSAIGLFNTVINFVLLYLTNTLSKRITETKLW